jgi:hypothetical protein
MLQRRLVPILSRVRLPNPIIPMRSDRIFPGSFAGNVIEQS